MIVQPVEKQFSHVHKHAMERSNMKRSIFTSTIFFAISVNCLNVMAMEEMPLMIAPVQKGCCFELQQNAIQLLTAVKERDAAIAQLAGEQKEKIKRMEKKHRKTVGYLEKMLSAYTESNQLHTELLASHDFSHFLAEQFLAKAFDKMLVRERCQSNVERMQSDAIIALQQEKIRKLEREKNKITYLKESARWAQYIAESRLRQREKELSISRRTMKELQSANDAYRQENQQYYISIICLRKENKELREKNK